LNISVYVGILSALVKQTVDDWLLFQLYCI